MSRINPKLGLNRPVGQRSMMKHLPRASAERAALTSAKCPNCGQTGARLSRVQPGAYTCSWCPTTWTPDPKE